MAKTIIIGIGGTGLSALRELRKLIAERFENALRDSEMNRVKFLYIDTDPDEIDRHDWSVLGKDISLSTNEIVTISGNNLGPIIQNIRNFPHIDSWLPEGIDFIGEPGPGAKGIRPYGKLIYEVNKNTINTKLSNIKQQLIQTAATGTEWKGWNFYLVAGLSGGTGSGMFLPLSLDMQRWSYYLRGDNTYKFYSFLVLPPLQVPPEHHERYHQNAYAALTELNYYNIEREQPYNNCYLLEPRNQGGQEIPIGNLPLLIAQRIFLNIQGGQAATAVASGMDNTILGETGDDTFTKKHSRAFSSFGISSVAYPQEIAAQCLSYQLSAKLVMSWLSENTQTTKINDDVQKIVQDLLISYDHIIGNSDPFGNDARGNFNNEIKTAVKEKLDKLSPKQLGIKAGDIRLEIEDTEFRGKGIKSFYSNLKKDINRAVDLCNLKLRNKLSEFLVDPQKGFSYTKEFVIELSKELNAFVDQIEENLYSDQIIKREKNFLTALNKSIDRIKLDEKNPMYNMFGREFTKNSNELSDELCRYLECSAGLRAGEYGKEVLKKVLIKVNAIVTDLTVWRSAMQKSRETLDSLTISILNDLSTTVKENGRAIFTAEELKRLEVKVRDENILEGLNGSISKKLRQPLDCFDVLSIKDVTEPHKIIYQSVYDLIVEKVKFRDILLYDKFLDGYPDSITRQELLSQAKNMSLPFVQFSPQEVARITRITYDTKTKATVPLDNGGNQLDGRTNKDIILDDLVRATGVALGNGALQSNDNERIVFLEEIFGFPLRFIGLLQQLKHSYESYKNKPMLHIDKIIQPSLYALYLMSAAEERKVNEYKAQETFVLGEALAWINLRTNTQTGSQEVFYLHRPRRELTASVNKKVLGQEIKSSFEAFVLDVGQSSILDSQVREARELMTQQYDDHINNSKQDDKIKTETLKKLNSLLATKQEEIGENFIDDEEYNVYCGIVERIIIQMGN